LAESKINKTPRSSNKKTQTKSVTSVIPVSEAPTLPPVTADPSLLSPEQRMAIAREVLLEISSAKADDCPMSQNDCPDEDCSYIGNHFAWGASQVNTDLAIAAQCEMGEDIYLTDGSFCDLLRSSEYWKLRQTFLEDAEDGDSHALLAIVWRAYNAGLVSPDRLIPDSRGERQERALRRHEMRRASKAAERARELKEAEAGK
jgi:hypothetical protein